MSDINPETSTSTSSTGEHWTLKHLDEDYSDKTFLIESDSECDLLIPDLPMDLAPTFPKEVCQLQRDRKSENNEKASMISSSQTKSSVQRRKEDSDRFKTHVIRKEDLSFFKHREADSGFVPDYQLVSDFDDTVEADAKLVVAAFSIQRGRSRSSDKRNRSKARSHSMEILDDSILDQEFDVGSYDSTCERQQLVEAVESTRTRPRICKPWESQNHLAGSEGTGVRGRRKPLYCPKKLTLTSEKDSGVGATVKSASVVPTNPRASRMIIPRQMSTLGASTSVGMVAPRPYNRSASVSRGPSLGSARPPIIRQGTFTKDDKQHNLKNYSEPKNMEVKDCQEMSRFSRTVVNSSLRSPRSQSRPAQTRTSSLRERSRVRQATDSNQSNGETNLSVLTNKRSVLKPPSTTPSCRPSPTERLTPTTSELELKGQHTSNPANRIAGLWKKSEEFQNRPTAIKSHLPQQQDKKPHSATPSFARSRTLVSDDLSGRSRPEPRPSRLPTTTTPANCIPSKPANDKTVPSKQVTTSNAIGSGKQNQILTKKITRTNTELLQGRSKNTPSLIPKLPAAIVTPFNYNRLDSKDFSPKAPPRGALKRNNSYISSIQKDSSDLPFKSGIIIKTATLEAPTSSCVVTQV